MEADRGRKAEDDLGAVIRVKEAEVQWWGMGASSVNP